MKEGCGNVLLRFIQNDWPNSLLLQKQWKEIFDGWFLSEMSFIDVAS